MKKVASTTTYELTLDDLKQLIVEQLSFHTTGITPEHITLKFKEEYIDDQFSRSSPMKHVVGVSVVVTNPPGA